MLIDDLFENSIDPEQQKMDLIRAGRLSREREPAGSDAIDARLAANNNARQKYAETGNFWLKQKDTQQHINDHAYVGKAAANAAALELLKQQPELRGNLVITAYGPGETQGVAEGPNDGKEDNFTIDDIKNLERIRDLETLKAQAKELIKGKPARRMKPEKISWFYNHIDTLKNPLAVIKMMYDLMLAGEGNKVIGSRNSMSSNSYRSKFGEQGVAEGSGDVGNTIRQLYQQFYDQGDDALEYLNTHAPLFAQFWDQYEGDLDSIIAEVSPKNLIRIAQELKQIAGEQGVAEAPGAETLGHNQSTVASNLNSLDLGEGSSERVGFSLDSERAYQAVMSRFGDMIDQDQDSGTMYAPERLWPKIEQVAYDADGIGAQRDDDLENAEHYGVAEGEKVGNMDADRFDDAMARLKKLAGAGPMKTVYDPNKRVYKNVPTAVQPGTKK